RAATLTGNLENAVNLKPNREKKLSLKTAGNLKISTKIQIFEKCLSKYFKTCSVSESSSVAWVSQAAGYHVTSHLDCPSRARLIDISASHGLHFSNPDLTHHGHRGESVDACRVLLSSLSRVFKRGHVGSLSQQRRLPPSTELQS
ncbi:unnamed protein product, partial [Meganyctiphanes norvegica]